MRESTENAQSLLLIEAKSEQGSSGVAEMQLSTVLALLTEKRGQLDSEQERELLRLLQARQSPRTDFSADTETG